MKGEGRPRCKKICCRESEGETIVRMYCEEGKSSDEIAAEVGVSDDHIIKRLHFLDVKCRGRGSYRRKRNGVGRRGVLWELEDKELFFTSVKELCKKYLISEQGVQYVRRRRRKDVEERAKKSDA